MLKCWEQPSFLYVYIQKFQATVGRSFRIQTEMACNSSKMITNCSCLRVVSGLSFIGLCWPSLAIVGLCWPLLAFVGPSLAFVGLRWLILAFVGLYWPLLAYIGLCWPSLAFVGLHWPSLAFIGLHWPGLRLASLRYVWNIWQNTVKYDIFVNLDPSQSKVNNRDPIIKSRLL